MGATSWNDDEEDALSYLPWEAQVLYLRGLRRFMDYQTGVVGVKRRVSYQGFSELLEVQPERGSKRAPVSRTKSQLRALLLLLGRAGLIARVPGYEKGLVFRCCLATLDKSAQMRNNTGTTHEQHTSNNTAKSNNSAASERMNDTGTTHEQHSMNNTHQESGIRNKAISRASANTARARVDDPLFAVLADFTINEQPLFSDGQLSTDKVKSMLSAWRALRVTPADVSFVLQEVVGRNIDGGFGPVFLDGPMRDYKAKASSVSNRPAGGVHDRVVQEHERVESQEMAVSRYAADHGYVFDPRAGQPYAVWFNSVRLAMRQQQHGGSA